MSCCSETEECVVYITYNTDMWSARVEDAQPILGEKKNHTKTKRHAYMCMHMSRDERLGE